MKITKAELRKDGWENCGEQGWQKGNEYLIVTIQFHGELSGKTGVRVELYFTGEHPFSKHLDMETMKEVKGLSNAFKLS